VPHEAEVVCGVAAQAYSVVVSVVLEKSELAEVRGRGVELHTDTK